MVNGQVLTVCGLLSYNVASIAEVRKIEFRQTRQLKPNLYFKVDDLHIAK